MISVHETEKLSLQQIEQFLLAAKEVRFEASQREEIYGWVERLLCQQEYVVQGRRARGLLRRYLGKMTGLSRAQLARLVGRYLATGRVQIKTSHRHRFPTRYTRAEHEWNSCPSRFCFPAPLSVCSFIGVGVLRGETELISCPTWLYVLTESRARC
jgi:hypothetical protein